MDDFFSNGELFSIITALCIIYFFLRIHKRTNKKIDKIIADEILKRKKSND